MEEVFNPDLVPNKVILVNPLNNVNDIAMIVHHTGKWLIFLQDP